MRASMRVSDLRGGGAWTVVNVGADEAGGAGEARLGEGSLLDSLSSPSLAETSMALLLLKKLIISRRDYANKKNMFCLFFDVGRK